MRQLLEMWMELEPDRCGVSEPLPFKNGGVIWRLDVGYSVDDLAIDEDFGNALIQYAVQKSIENKGWLWSLPNRIDRNLYEEWSVSPVRDDEYSAIIMYDDESFVETFSAKTPVHALLSAYIKTLEITR